MWTPSSRVLQSARVVRTVQVVCFERPVRVRVVTPMLWVLQMRRNPPQVRWLSPVLQVM